jgi:hypothetical protein
MLWRVVVRMTFFVVLWCCEIVVWCGRVIDNVAVT